ncbi:MAG: GGDEF domain-containing protein [Campylobacterota bacterium]|nr:GGDEF domain-containing protein [Campylobacterota bacterium]
MKNTMLNLIKLAMEDKTKFKSLENIYSLYDQLQYSENLNEMASSLYDWLYEKYEVNNMSFSLFDMEKNLTTEILKKGGEFFLDGEYSFYFIINTHTELNAVVSFAASNQEHYDIVNNDYSYIEAAFFQISPILQNGIMKKHHIEASSIDSVTNVHNRKYLIKHINKIISLSGTDDGLEQKNIAFLMVGIDRFKAVIEEFDYDIGDKVLVELAKVIHGQIKDFDIVARLTGDEFLVALVNAQSIDLVENVAQEMIEKFSKVEILVNKETNQTLKKTICVGISLYPQDSDDINKVLKNADNFLYEAKNKGRGKIAVFSQEDESSIDLF